MGTITTSDGTEIFYKDWGSGQAIVFSHGWPLSADDWDTQMLFFLLHGYRVIAPDRRGHGRSTQTSDGHDMDHYADDLAAVTATSRPPRRRSRRPLDRGRRGRPLHRPTRRDPRRQSGAHQLGTAARWCRPTPTLAACPRACSTICKPSLPPTGPSSTGRYRQDPFMATTGRVSSLRSDHSELVAPGDDGGSQGALRRHRGLLADRLHRGPEEDQRPGPGDARRRRPDRPLRRLRPAVREARAERDAEDATPDSHTVCRPLMPTRSTPICWPSSSPDGGSGGWVFGDT